MNQTKKLLLFFLSIGLFWSCSEDDTSVDSVTSPEEHKPIPSLSWDETVIKVAQDVAEKMNDERFRKTLKHEVMLQFDGDYNILLSSMVNRMPIYNAYKENVQAMSSNSTENGYLSHLDFSVIEQAAKDYPQMQLAVQVNADLWNPETEKLSVVYVPSHYDEKSHKSVDGFDVKGNSIKVSTLEDPIENYVVVSMNERTFIENGIVYLNSTYYLPSIAMICFDDDSDFNPQFTPPTFDRIVDCEYVRPDPPYIPPPSNDPNLNPPVYEQYIGTGHNGQKPTLIAIHPTDYVETDNVINTNNIAQIGNINGQPFYRGNYKYERIREMRLDKIGEIEGWPAGAPEIRVHVFTLNQFDPSEELEIFLEEFEPARRRDIKDKWWDNPDVAMHLWDWENTGDRMTYGFYEYDPALSSEELEAIGQGISNIIDTLDIVNDTIQGVIDITISTLTRNLEKENGRSEYMGKDDISIFNNKDYFEHNAGDFKFKTWPDVD